MIEEQDAWAVYRCRRIERGQMPQGEVVVSLHATAWEAMDEADRLKSADRENSYVVGWA